MQSTMLFCVVCVSLIATAHGGLLFAVHPVSREVNTTGEAVTLQCTATSEGEITHWVYNGETLDPASVSGVSVSTSAGSGGSSTLSISSFETSHAGDYRCAARSVSSPSHVEVSHGALVAHFAHRTFTTQPQDFTVYNISPREAVAFNCEFAEFIRYGRRPVIVWEYESASAGTSMVLDLEGSPTMSSFQYDHIGYFQLHTPTDTDNGSRVRCIARHPDDASQEVTSDWATIVISAEPRPVDFPLFTTTMPSQVHRIEGQQLVLGCSKSTPTTSVPLQWLENGTPFFTAGVLFIFGRDDITFYGTSNVLVLDAHLDSLVGNVYMCRATVEPDIFIQNTTIVAAPPPLPPLNYNDPPPQVGTIVYGARLALIVNTSDASYTGRVQWWVNGILVPATAGSSQKYTVSDDMQTLTVSNIVLSDSGLYQAELLDAQPAVQFYAFQVAVRGGAAFVSGGESEVRSESGSSSVVITCPTDGNVPPVTSYTWSRNGVEIVSDGTKHTIAPDGSLTISNVELGDAGTYSCTPANAVGSSNSTSTRLDITATIDIAWVDAVYPLVDGVTGLSCVTPFPAGLTISSTGRLSASNVQLSFNGEYQCQLDPAYDGDIFVNLRVVGGGEAFVSGGESEVRSESGSSSVVITCPTDGNVPPVTSYTWSRNGVEIVSDGTKHTIASDGSLTISNVELGDAGTYSCTPANALGSFNSTSTRLDIGMNINVDWTRDFERQLVDGITELTCATQLPDDLTISNTGLLKIVDARLSFTGEYRCQLTPDHEGYIIVNLQVQGYPPIVPKILYVGIVDEGSIKVNWTTDNNPLRPVDNYFLEIRTSHRDRTGGEDDGNGDEDGDGSDGGHQGDDGDGGVMVKRQFVSRATNKHIISDPDPKLAYSFRVEAVNEAGSSGYSEEYKLETKETGATSGGRGPAGLAGWEIALIVIFLLLLLLLCFILILCICLCWRREKRTYHAAKIEKQNRKDFEAYRPTGEPDNKA